MDSPDIDFSLAEWKKETKSVQVYIQKPVQTLQLLASYQQSDRGHEIRK